jgi:arylsulfatase A-like enzyme
MPSLCDVAGVAAPAGRNLCGRSYAPIAMNRPMPPKQPWRNLVFGHFRNTEMARDKRFKLVIRDGGEGPGELYDLAIDPREKVNRYNAQEFVTVRHRLGADLDAWRKKYA